jgi:hypothetical protein
MVEVWLPYRDTEIPIMLPDPIDLKIAPKTILPETREYEILNRLYRILRERKKIKVSFNPISDEAEKTYIKSILSKAEIQFEESNYTDSEVCIDIFRFDPLLKFKSSLWTGYLSRDPLKRLKEVYPVDDLDPLEYFEVDEDKLYIDLIIDGGPRLVNLFSSTDGSHFKRAKSFYGKRWCLKANPSNLVIGSVGGFPWDSSFYLVVHAFIKMITLLPEGGIGILVGDGITKDIDPTKIKNFSIDKIDKPGDFYLLRLLNTMDRSKGTLVYYGSIPGTIIRLLGFRKIKDVEAYIKNIPKKVQRDVLIAEDITFLYPYSCIS